MEILKILKGFLRSVSLADMWKGLINPSDTAYSSTRFVAVFSGVLLPVGWVTLAFYCAYNQIGMPGGSAEGFIGLFTIATLGKAYTSYTETKTKTSDAQTEQAPEDKK